MLCFHPIADCATDAHLLCFDVQPAEVHQRDAAARLRQFIRPDLGGHFQHLCHRMTLQVWQPPSDCLYCLTMIQVSNLLCETQWF